MIDKLLAKCGLAMLATCMLSTTTPALAEHSPFDQKIAATGFYQWKTSNPDTRRSIDELFTVARSFRYKQERNTDHWQTPQETESSHAGDCEDKAVWLYWVLKTNGYENVALHVGRYRSADSRLHAWITVADESGDWVLDPTTQRRIWRASEFSADYYRTLFQYTGAQA